MTINAANLAFNGITNETGSNNGYSSLNGRYQWTYTDNTQTVAQLDGESSTASDVTERLRAGDFVEGIGNNGSGLFIVSFVSGTITLNSIAPGQPAAAWWV